MCCRFARLCTVQRQRASFSASRYSKDTFTHLSRLILTPRRRYTCPRFLHRTNDFTAAAPSGVTGSARLGSTRSTRAADIHTSRFQRHCIEQKYGRPEIKEPRKRGPTEGGWVGGHAVRDGGRPSGSRHRIPVTRQDFLKETPSAEGFPV